MAESSFQIKRAANWPPLVSCGISGLERLDALCLPPLGSLYDGKLNRLALFQAAETVSLNCREVNEDILAVLPADESITLRVVEPLHCTLFHMLLSNPLIL